MNLQATNLLVDIGNTRLKWALGNQDEITSDDTILNTKVSRAYLIQLWQDIASPRQLAIACVSSRHLLETVVSAANELWPTVKITQALSQAESFGVTNAYVRPETLGVDRWLGMVAAYHRYQATLCVVGCGTAVTVDIIAKGGQHLGGYICPGLRLMQQALAHNTENLSMANAATYAIGLGNCTEAAIHNGAVLAVCGLIEKSIKTQGDNLKLILTGGDADLIKPYLTTPAILEPNLVFSGLALTLPKPA